MEKTILITDDSSIVLDINSFALKSGGYKTLICNNGQEALETILQHNVDLIITDIHMPGMDGITMVKEIRKIKKYKETPIIIITTDREAQLKKKGFDAGANLYIVKPFDSDELLMNVKMLLGNNE